MNEELFDKERLARKNNDLESLKSIFMSMLTNCSNDQEVISLLKVLSVRRGQSTEAMRWFINEIYIRKKSDKSFISELITEVVEGKMYLERERVMYTLELMNQASTSAEALSYILEVPVETFTLIDDKTIINYQLNQFRLCIEVSDWIKADIIMKRIRQKYFDENNAYEEKLQFLKYNVQLLLGQSRYFEASKLYFDINVLYEKSEYIILASFFCIIGCNYNKQTLESFYNVKNNDPQMRSVLSKLQSDLIISKNVIDSLRTVLNPYLDINIYNNQILEAINKHNFYVIEKFYSIINFDTFLDLMEFNEQELINFVSKMVNEGKSKCKINQLQKTITFKKKENNKAIDDVLDKLVKVNHLIHKELLNKN